MRELMAEAVTERCLVTAEGIGSHGRIWARTGQGLVTCALCRARRCGQDRSPRPSPERSVPGPAGHPHPRPQHLAERHWGRCWRNRCPGDHTVKFKFRCDPGGRDGRGGKPLAPSRILRCSFQGGMWARRPAIKNAAAFEGTVHERHARPFMKAAAGAPAGPTSLHPPLPPMAAEWGPRRRLCPHPDRQNLCRRPCWGER